MNANQKQRSCLDWLLCRPPRPSPPQKQPSDSSPQNPLQIPEQRISEIEEKFLSKIIKPDRVKMWKDYFRVSKISNIQQLMIAWNNSKGSAIGRTCNEAEQIVLSKIYAQFNSTIRNLVWKQEMLNLQTNNLENNKRKNILVIGITGQGKTTFINSYANYANNIDFESSIRYKVIDDEQRNQSGNSVTNTVTSFPIPKGDFVFNFIDTPGLADTRGLERDQQIIESISNYLINDLHQNGQILNQVIIVSQSSTDYLIRNKSPSLLQLAMLSVLKLFGRNMSTFTMHALTFSDFTAGSVDNFESKESLFYRLSEQQRINETTLRTQKTQLQQTPLIQQQQTLFTSSGSSENQQLLNTQDFNGGVKYCQLQNSVFFTKSCGQIQNIQLKKNYENYDRLSQKIESSEGFSLEETITVINERKRIKHTIDELNGVLRLRVQIERIITSNLNRIRQFEQKMDNSKDFTYIEYKPLKSKVDVDCMVTNCQQCQLSCHYDCRVERLRTCTMMVRLGNGEIVCDSCQHNVEQHTNERFKYQIRLVETLHTYEDLKQEFEAAQSEADCYKKKREQELQRQQENDAAITEILAKMRQSFNTLYSSALYQLDLSGGSLKSYIYRFFREYDQQLEKYFENDLNSTALLHQTTNMFQTALLQQTTLQRVKTDNFKRID